jgi:esterase/lipase superfamily enzyme
MFHKIKNHLIVSLIPVLAILLSGCQSKVYLMPMPIAIRSDTNIFNMREDNKDENLLYTLYATNRLPRDTFNKSKGYTIFPSDTLELGYVIYRVGDRGMTWNELFEKSINSNREKKLLLSQEYIREMVKYSKDDNLRHTSARADGFFDKINTILAGSIDKDLTIYVHGANSNFYRATAQGAQYYHYTGQNSIVITFSWPSAENLLKYKTDVLHARQTVSTFIRLLETLAYHTKAKKINILAYSAGAQVVAPALAALPALHPELSAKELKNRLRIGEVYFAAPDTALKPFLERYLKFNTIVERTTININKNDTVLRLASLLNRRSRLGRPDNRELDDNEMKKIVELTRTPTLNILDLSGSEALKLGRAHDSWYSHPWVSSDLLLLFLFNATPEERGLTAQYSKAGLKIYLFPPNYDSHIKQLIDEQREEFLLEVMSAKKEINEK